MCYSNSINAIVFSEKIFKVYTIALWREFDVCVTELLIAVSYLVLQYPHFAVSHSSMTHVSFGIL